MSVGEWLSDLGLGQYERNFQENKVDADVLPHLTVDDLRDIGVVAVGDRRRLIAAIAALGNTAPSGEATAAKHSVLPKGPRLLAERRPITVMFCDLVGSTGLASRLDAEDWRNVVTAYLDEASQAVTGLGGHVLKKLGDGLMALFGYPAAQENDAERAVRAALAIQRSLAEKNAKNAGKGAVELSARIGLESGPVVVDPTGEVFGEAPNIASRVQAAAPPGAVVVTLNVHRQVAGLFVAEELGTHELKGVSEPVKLFRLVRASGAGRLGGVRSLTPLVGRDEELGLLVRRWERARIGEGQLTLIVGEPGLGKSRLIEELHGKLAETPHTWIEWRASQLLQNTPFHPIAEWGRLRFGGAEVPSEQRFAELERGLRQVNVDFKEAAQLIAPLLDISVPPERSASSRPDEMRRRQLELIVSWIFNGARTQPIVLTFEDLHWADPTSVDVLRALAERGGQSPLFIVATLRPEFRPPWAMRSHHSAIALAPLDHAQVQRMIGEIASRHSLSNEVVEGVSERSGGVPLFVEEVTRMLLERGEQGGVQVIPLTLQQSLAARLDRLGPSREVAQIGAVLGRDFSRGLLQGLAGAEETELQSALDQLAEADILIVQGSGPLANYRFKHALIQDAAYQSLLRSRRQGLHRKAAEILRDISESAAAEPEAIAHHFTEAGLEDLAIEWWGKAGDHALRRSAFQEAVSHLGKAIELTDKIRDFGSPIEVTLYASDRLKLQTNYARAMMWLKGIASDEAKAAFARANELGVGADIVDERFTTHYGIWLNSLVRGDLELAQKTAETFRDEAVNWTRPTEVAVADRFLGFMSLVRGDLRQARSQLEDALRIYDPERDRDTRFKYGIDTRFGATLYLAEALLGLGDVKMARKLIEDSVSSVSASNSVPDLLNASLFKGIHEASLGNAEAVIRAVGIITRASQKHAPWPHIMVLSGWASARLGDRATGMMELRRGLAEYTDQGAKILVPFLQGLFAEIEAEGPDPKEALVRLDEALALARDTGEHWTDAFLYRLRGEILSRLDNANSALAEQAFQTALAIARQQNRRLFVLRSALSLAKLYQSTGRPAEVRAVLCPALEGFDPTPELPEVAEAQAILSQWNCPRRRLRDK